MTSEGRRVGPTDEQLADEVIRRFSAETITHLAARKRASEMADGPTYADEMARIEANVDPATTALFQVRRTIGVLRSGGIDDDLASCETFKGLLRSGVAEETAIRAVFDETDRQADLVVIDTMARAVAGDENSADTYRNFYKHTASKLKAAGIALLRLDHQGKDANAGQRGSSAKDDDLDVVFHLKVLDRGQVQLTRTRSRINWVPPEVTMVRREEPELGHVIVGGGVPAGTHECILDLDELDVPLDATAAVAMDALRRCGKGRRKLIVLAALKARRER